MPPAPTLAEDLTQKAHALKRAGRHSDAIALYIKVARLRPGDGAAEHNLAGALCAAERFAEAEAAARRALATGLDAPETWLVLGRALQRLARLDEAEAAYRRALKRRPAYADAVSDLAELIWMRTADAGAALSPIEAAIRSAPADPMLRIVKAKLLEYAGDGRAALATITASLGAGIADPRLDVVAAQLLATVDPARAVAHAHRAAAGGDPTAAASLCEALLAAGDIPRAAKLAERLRQAWPDDQHALALQVTAWRLAGDPRAAALCAYDELVGVDTLDTPDGWPSLPAFLADLAARLDLLHPLLTHPIGQSPRGGSQTQQRLDLMDDPLITAFFRAADGPIRRRIAALGPGTDPVRARSLGGYEVYGAWSVRLRPGGYHADHVHPKGWLSSACYIALPEAIETGRQGWLRFGRPGPPTRPALQAEHYVKPRPGRLVLFPSYLWHGTEPFGGDTPRLTIAFDIVPAAARATSA